VLEGKGESDKHRLKGVIPGKLNVDRSTTPPNLIIIVIIIIITIIVDCQSRGVARLPQSRRCSWP
jgi:hypothetical protein